MNTPFLKRKQKIETRGAASLVKGREERVMLRPEIAALYIGINILILLALSVLVVRGRQRHKIVLGVREDNPAFTRAVRAHANAAEYIPAGLVGIVMLAWFNSAPLWILHAAGISLTAGRILHGFGLHTGDLNLGRLLGMVLIWASFLLTGATLTYLGLGQHFGG